jgi:tRNA 2-thiouridine synthesizing protein A
MKKRQEKKNELDTSGLYCPYPLVKTKAALRNLREGETLRVISTDPASQIDFKVFTETTSHDLLESYQENSRFIFVIRK